MTKSPYNFGSRSIVSDIQRLSLYCENLSIFALSLVAGAWRLMMKEAPARNGDLSKSRLYSFTQLTHKIQVHKYKYI